MVAVGNSDITASTFSDGTKWRAFAKKDGTKWAFDELETKKYNRITKTHTKFLEQSTVVIAKTSYRKRIN